MIRLHKVIADHGEFKGQVVPQTYTACNGKYYIEKGTLGWNLYQVHKLPYGEHLEYITAYETLRDLREDLAAWENDQ